jgi:hypothetical protein
MRMTALMPRNKRQPLDLNASYGVYTS